MRWHLDGDGGCLAALLTAAFEGEAHGVRVRHIAGQRLGDGGLQFGRAVAVEQPLQTDSDGTEVGATLSSADQQVRGGRHRLRQAIRGTVPAGRMLLLLQGLDMRGVLDLRPLVVAARMAGE